MARKGKVSITWRPVSEATSYEARISKPGGKKYLSWREMSGAKFTARVVKGKKYRVQILAVGTGGRGPIKTVAFRGR